LTEEPVKRFHSYYTLPILDVHLKYAFRNDLLMNVLIFFGLLTFISECFILL
jgi:hypothetical protein